MTRRKGSPKNVFFYGDVIFLMGTKGSITKCAGNKPSFNLLSKYSVHSSVPNIKREFSSDAEFELTYIDAKDITQNIKSLIVNENKRSRWTFC